MIKGIGSLPKTGNSNRLPLLNIGDLLRRNRNGRDDDGK